MKYLVLVSVLLFCACKTQNSNAFTPDFETPAPPVLVYKTKTNYNNLVPVLLSDDKSEIISYPHPTDLKSDDTYALPTTLKEGYLIDNRGIGKNVAFLKLTYEEYAALSEAPMLKKMYALIIDKDPLVELCNCGNKAAFTNISEQLNALIKKDKLRTTCKVVK